SEPVRDRGDPAGPAHSGGSRDGDPAGAGAPGRRASPGTRAAEGQEPAAGVLSLSASQQFRAGGAAVVLRNPDGRLEESQRLRRGAAGDHGSADAGRGPPDVRPLQPDRGGPGAPVGGGREGGGRRRDRDAPRHDTRCDPMRRAAAALAPAVLVLLSTAAWAAPVAAPAPDPRALTYPPLPIPFPKPQKFLLPNGLLVYLFEDHELPLIDAAIDFKAGGVFDPPAKPGLASLAATLMRAGGTE